jgi:hypothetical protein
MHELAVRNLLQALSGDLPAAALNPQVSLDGDPANARRL